MPPVTPLSIVADANIPFVAQAFGKIGTIETLDDKRINSGALSTADVLVCRATIKVNAHLLDGTSVKFVALAVSGTDRIDMDSLKLRKIGFAASVGANANSVAEYVIAVLLHFARRDNFSLADKSLGVIGAGHIGSRVAQKAAALGMRVILNDPPLEQTTGLEVYRPIEEIYCCDFITLHVPLNHSGPDATYHLLDDRFFGALEGAPVIINTSRGDVVDSTALEEAIKNGSAGGAALDVWEKEPTIETKLLEMVDIGTPHIAGFALDGRVRGMIWAFNAVCQYFNINHHLSEEEFLGDSTEDISIAGIGSTDFQELTANLVTEFYSVHHDDEVFRRIINLPVNERSSFFRELRKSYRNRREFDSAPVRLEGDQMIHAERLEQVGFKIKNQ